VVYRHDILTARVPVYSQTRQPLALGDLDYQPPDSPIISKLPTDSSSLCSCGGAVLALLLSLKAHVIFDDWATIAAKRYANEEVWDMAFRVRHLWWCWSWEYQRFTNVVVRLTCVRQPSVSFVADGHSASPSWGRAPQILFLSSYGQFIFLVGRPL
jgi:hypothetical protein